MLEAIAPTPELATLTTRATTTTRSPSLELWAAVADVLTFYQERYANEAFLRTATRRESVAALARLLDYRLAPGCRRARVARVHARRRQAASGSTRACACRACPARTSSRRSSRRSRPSSADCAPEPAARAARAVGRQSARRGRDRGARSLRAQAGARRLASWRAATASLSSRRPDGDGRGHDDRRRPRRGGPRRPRAGTGRSRATWDAASAARQVGRTFRLFGHTAPEQSMMPRIRRHVPGGIDWTLKPDHLRPARQLDARRSTRAVKDLATGARLLVDDEAGRDDARHGHRRRDDVAEPRRLTDSVTVLAVTPAHPGHRRSPQGRRSTSCSARRSRSGAPLPGAAHRRHGVLPGRLVDAETIEVGRTIVAGIPSRACGCGSRTSRRAGRCSSATRRRIRRRARIESAALVGSTVTFEPTPRTRRASGAGARRAPRPVACLVSGPLHSSFALSAPADARRAIGELGAAHADAAGRDDTCGCRGRARGRAARRGTEPELATRACSRSTTASSSSPAAEGGEIVFTGTERTTRPSTSSASGPSTRSPRGRCAPRRCRATITLTNPAPELAVTIGPVGPRVVAPPSGVEHQDARVRCSGRTIALGRRGTVVPPVVDLRRRRPAARLPGPGRRRGRRVPAARPRARGRRSTSTPATAYLLGNVAAASHGETVRDEVLGDGDASAPFQRFALQEGAAHVPAGRRRGRRRVDARGARQRRRAGTRCPGSRPAAHRRGVRGAHAGRRLHGRPVRRRRDRRAAADRPGQRRRDLPRRRRASPAASARDALPRARPAARPARRHEPARRPRRRRPGDARRRARERARAPCARSAAPCRSRLRGPRPRLGRGREGAGRWVWDGLERAIHLTVAGQAGGLFAADDLRRLGACARPRARSRTTGCGSRTTRRSRSCCARRSASTRGTSPTTSWRPRARPRSAALSFDARRARHAAPPARHLPHPPGRPGRRRRSTSTSCSRSGRRTATGRNVDLLPDGVTPSPLQPHVAGLPGAAGPGAPGACCRPSSRSSRTPAHDVTLVAAGASA